MRGRPSAIARRRSTGTRARSRPTTGEPRSAAPSSGPTCRCGWRRQPSPAPRTEIRAEVIVKAPQGTSTVRSWSRWRVAGSGAPVSMGCRTSPPDVAGRAEWQRMRASPTPKLTRSRRWRTTTSRRRRSAGTANCRTCTSPALNRLGAMLARAQGNKVNLDGDGLTAITWALEGPCRHGTRFLERGRPDRGARVHGARRDQPRRTPCRVCWQRTR